MRRYWTLTHRSPEIYESEWSVRLSEEPAWAHAVGTVWNGACALTRGWLGGHGRGAGVLFSTPVGRPKWDHRTPDDPWLENSLGSMLYRIENWMLTRSDDHGKQIADIAITESVARGIDPDFVDQMHEIHAEAGHDG